MMKRGRDSECVFVIVCDKKGYQHHENHSQTKISKSPYIQRAMYRSQAKMEHRCLFRTATLPATLFHFFSTYVHNNVQREKKIIYVREKKAR